MEIDYKAIGKRVREARKRLGITQSSLAEKANLSDTLVSHIERGATKLSLPSIIAVANALETSVDSLLMDVIDRSEAEFDREFSLLLGGLSPFGRRLIYNACKSISEDLKRNAEGRT